MPARRRGRRDLEADYPPKRFAAKLRRLADAIETGGTFRIQIAGERVVVPASAVINLEHERSADEEEIEFQLRWSLAPRPAPAPGPRARPPAAAQPRPRPHSPMTRAPR